MFITEGRLVACADDEGRIISCGREEILEQWMSVRFEKYNYFFVDVEVKPIDDVDEFVCPCGESHTREDCAVLGMVCGRCKKHTGNETQGHFWAVCKVWLKEGRGVPGSLREHHFCCPGNCELEAKSV